MKQQNCKCQVCREKELNWLHEESCRAKNPLTWFFLDFNRASINKDDNAKGKAVNKYIETIKDSINV